VAKLRRERTNEVAITLDVQFVKACQFMKA